MTTKDKNISAEQELFAKDICEKEREVSDRKYAIKLVEKIVFTFVGLVLLAFAGALIGLIIVNGK